MNRIKLLMKNAKRYAAFAFIGVALFAMFSFTSPDKTSPNYNFAKSLEIFFNVLREINVFYVDQVKSEDKVKTAINEMLSTLDPYTTYIPDEDM